jgi:hypothetical protein
MATKQSSYPFFSQDDKGRFVRTPVGDRARAGLPQPACAICRAEKLEITKKIEVLLKGK